MSQTKNKPIKLTQAERMTKASVFWLSVLLFIALPFINNFILQTVALNISGNIAYKDLAPALNTVRDLLSVFSSYAGVGVLAAAIANFGAKNAVGTVILALSSHIVGLFSAMLSYALSGARNYSAAVFLLGVDALVNILIYAVILAILSIIRKKDRTESVSDSLQNKMLAKGGAYTYITTAIGVFGGAQLAATLYSMISAFVDPSIGTPINLQEWIYWITEYLTLFIYVGIGYIIVLGVFWLCKYYRAHFADTM